MRRSAAWYPADVVAAPAHGIHLSSRSISGSSAAQLAGLYVLRYHHKPFGERVVGTADIRPCDDFEWCRADLSLGALPGVGDRVGQADAAVRVSVFVRTDLVPGVDDAVVAEQLDRLPADANIEQRRDTGDHVDGLVHLCPKVGRSELCLIRTLKMGFRPFRVIVTLLPVLKMVPFFAPPLRRSAPLVVLHLEMMRTFPGTFDEHLLQSSGLAGGVGLDGQEEWVGAIN